MIDRPTHENESARALFNSSHVGQLAIDLEAKILSANQLAKRLLEINSGDSLQNASPDLWEIITNETTTRDSLLITALPKEEINYAIYVDQWKDKENLIGYLCSIYPYEEIERLARYTEVFQDMSHEESVIINSSSDGLWICDADAKVVRMNPASERLNNIKAEDAIGKHMEDLVADGVFDKSVTLEVIKHKKITSLLQKRGDRTLLLTAAPVFNQQKELIRVVVSERDLTEIENLQKALEDQEALKNKYREQILALHQAQAGERQIIAKSADFIKVVTQAIKVSSADSTVLILGESGVGKGLIADLIHENSVRSDKPIIKLNCGAIPEALIESELFGYEKGAFTGAENSKAGQFELANGGILFLDEVAELPLSSQVKLLRFLEDGCITRLGSTQKKELNVRVLAATHRDLDAMVKEGRFRLDLYYRLKVIPLQVPALRERRDCIIPLLQHHIDYFCKKTGTQKRLSSEAANILTTYDYPGNVRELINLCERLVVMTDSSVISKDDLPQEIVSSVTGESWTIASWSKDRTLAEILADVEERIFRGAFDEYRNQYKVASALGVSQATVARRLQKYGINQEQ